MIRNQMGGRWWQNVNGALQASAITCSEQLYSWLRCARMLRCPGLSNNLIWLIRARRYTFEERGLNGTGRQTTVSLITSTKHHVTLLEDISQLVVECMNLKSWNRESIYSLCPK